ncbi:YtxH domain-containing protein [Plebeiibacterium sediminum]|uniref:YtxH domain-containing protein n=1 Tax=Plebeiibacterium sediminum TaxID=2992112 RepID=A0AAE3M0R1_9BACT|nr:YtxH domain-containing protein [Plebeiobacterium sediminum]MCW3784894.1 YtxH domain-containing protein [Plebeiobacterium sediminum]
MSNTKTILGILGGAAVGAIAGVLFAPDKGYKTRRKIKKESQRVTKNATKEVHRKMEDMKGHVNHVVDDLKSQLSQAEAELKSKLNHVRNKKSEEVIES